MNGYHFGGELTVTSGKNEADFTPEELKEFKTLSELGQSIYSFTSHLNMTTWAVSPPFYYHYLNSYKRPPRVVTVLLNELSPDRIKALGSMNRRKASITQ